jgi:uncharacterized protein YjiK
VNGLFFAALIFAPAEVRAELVFKSSFSTAGTIPNGPDGVAFDPSSGNLFAVDSQSSSVYELTTTGALVNSFEVSSGNGFPQGIDILPNGNLVVVDQGGTINDLTEYTTTGDFVSTVTISIVDDDSPVGVVFNAATGTFFVADQFEGDFHDGRILEFDTSGNHLNTINTHVFAGRRNAVPQGIHVDPVSGNLWMVSNDVEKFFEFTFTPTGGRVDGELIDDVDLAALTGFHDAEGIAFDSNSATLYISFDSDGQIASFTVPEPASLTLLSSTCCLMIVLIRRHGCT